MFATQTELVTYLKQLIDGKMQTFKSSMIQWEFGLIFLSFCLDESNSL